MNRSGQKLENGCSDRRIIRIEDWRFAVWLESELPGIFCKYSCNNCKLIMTCKTQNNILNGLLYKYFCFNSHPMQNHVCPNSQAHCMFGHSLAASLWVGLHPSSRTFLCGGTSLAMVWVAHMLRRSVWIASNDITRSDHLVRTVGTILSFIYIYILP